MKLFVINLIIYLGIFAIGYNFGHEFQRPLARRLLNCKINMKGDPLCRYYARF